MPVNIPILLTWLPASRSALDSRWRIARLGLAVLVGAVLAKLVYDQLMPMLHLPSIADLARERKGEHAVRPIQWLNFIGDEGQDRIMAAYGEQNYRRLSLVKREFDPDNVFRENVNIRPIA